MGVNLEDATIVNHGLNNIRFREDCWDRFFLTVLSKFTGKYSRSLLTQIQSSLP